VPARSRRALALAAVAEQASGYVKHEILEQALATVLAIKDSGKRTESLVNLASHLCGTLLEHALTAARAVDYAPYQARALIALTPHLPKPLGDEVFKEASLAVQEIDDEHTRVENLISLAAYLPTPDREEAMRQVMAGIRALPHDFFKVGLIDAAAQHLPESLLHEADDVARGIVMDLDRSNTLLALAPLLAKSGRQTEALQLVQRVGHHGSDHAQAQALTRMAPYLKEEHLQKALKITGRLYAAEYRAEAVAGLGPYLPAKLLPMAFSIVGSMRHAVHQVEALATLVRKLPEAKRKEQFERVMMKAIHEYDSHSARSEALARLAPNLPKELLKLALSESRRIDDEKRQVQTLTVMAAVLPPEQRADTLRRALLKAQSIDRGRDRFEALAYLYRLA
jgi:hypothetical protein